MSSLARLVSKGESKSLGLKRSTGELREAMRTLCGFANGAGGRVVIGVKPDGTIVGQQVSDQTLHEIAAARDSSSLRRCQVAEGAVGTLLIMVNLPLQ